MLDGTLHHEGHMPVMMAEVLEALNLAPQNSTSGKTIVDGTFGGGGYTRHILNATDCHVIGIDRDPHAVARGQALEAETDRFKMIEGCFGDIEDLLNAHNIEKVDGFVLDLGVSSFQLDEAERGFSFMHDGPLDMCMGQCDVNAADIVNTYDETDIANILYQYGEERKSRHIARRIVERRKEKAFETTLDLARVIENTLGKSRKLKAIHPATRSFQALRIAVNDELGELDRALNASINILAPEGRLVVVSFHSLEDRRVKTFLREKSGQTPNVSRHLPVALKADTVYPYLCPEKRAKAASDQEASFNPRARSAKLRYGIRQNEK